MPRLKMFFDELALHIITDINLYIMFLPIVCFILGFIYKYLRQKFPVRVNCWFCNKDTSVVYNERNSFICPSCKQYNGFTEDGDYNKPIPEQQDELLNHIVTPTKYRPDGTTNGLCRICNNNQQLKVYQLANFVPLDDDNYDVEIEHFQKQLEKAYKLCPNCKSAVKKTISKQNRALLGKRIEDIRKSGKTLLNESTTAKMFSRRMQWYIACSVLCLPPAIYFCKMYELDVHQYCSLWLEEFSRELTFVFGGLFAIVIMQVMKHKTASTPIANTKIVKTENIFKDKNSKPSRCSAGSYTSNDNLSSGDISFRSFTSQLNSTIKSDDESSFSSELAVLHANRPSWVNRMRPSPTHHVFGEEGTLGNMSRYKPSSPMSTLPPCRSPIPSPTAFSSFKSDPFTKKSDLDLTFENLNLTNKRHQIIANAAHFEHKRPVVWPSKFRNPWTGKSWDTDALSRSSSQSSGIYSRATSICGDDVASVTLEPSVRNGHSTNADRIGLFSDFGSVKSQGFSNNYLGFDHINQTQPTSSMSMIYE